jgi:homoserine kinase
VSGIKVFAPASIGNLGIGFDIIGMALEKPGDEVIARKSNTSGVRITKITGHGGKLPYEAEKNTAGVAVLRYLEAIERTNEGIELEIHKKMPFGSGLGSSAASAVAGVFAVNELLRTGMSKREILPFACMGEQLASGGFHADNVAPCLLGGVILIRDNATLDVHRIHTPKGLYMAVAYPHIELLTKDARNILKPDIQLKQHVRQSANIGAFIIAMFNGDIGLLGRCLTDEIIEPQRAQLIPGFYDVKTAALEAGALGCSISGAGPSVFAFCQSSLVAENAGAAMQRAFAQHKIKSELYVSPINQEGAIAM